MKLDKDKLVMAAVIAVVVGGISLGWYCYRPVNNADFPDGTFWLCSNPKCNAETVLTMKQLGDHHAKHYGQPIPCPKCGAELLRADRCPDCKKLYPQQRNIAPLCPYCKKPPSPPKT